MNRDRVEEFAIRAALGNNGGAWAEHYTEEQKEHWRRFIRDLVFEIEGEMLVAAGALRASSPRPPTNSA